VKDTTVCRPAILVIEDEEDIADLLEMLLTDEGYDVRCAPTGVEGLALLDSHPPVLILLDMMLPGMGGAAVYAALRQHPAGRDVPVLIISAMAATDAIVAGLDMGAVDYLPKPFDMRELVARVKVALRRHSTIRDTQTGTKTGG
jgi:DNA-binding response OmpR family regulator